MHELTNDLARRAEHARRLRPDTLVTDHGPHSHIGISQDQRSNGHYAIRDLKGDELEALTLRQLELLGEDPTREGLHRTPARVAKSMTWLTKGHRMTPRDVVGDAIFHEERAGMVVVRDIEFYSLCEHHLLPFFGRVHIAYVPDGRIIGLSKLPRIVEVFARRLQVQERLTDEIAAAIEDVLQPLGVRVSIDAVHLCMMMRGVQKQQSSTITGAARGVFRTDSSLETEFQRIVNTGSGTYR